MGFDAEARLETRIQARSQQGRFVALADRDAERIATDLADRGAEFAKQNARRFRRTGSIERSIRAEGTGKTRRVVADHPGAHSVERGAVPHVIPNAFGKGKPARHPGNDPQPFIGPVAGQVKREADAIARRDARVGR